MPEPSESRSPSPAARSGRSTPAARSASANPRTGDVIRRLAGRGDLGTGENGLVADARGAWVVSPAREAILRVEGGRVVRRIPVDPGTGPVLARRDGALWVATGAGRPSRYRLVRIDEDTGAATASVGIGTEQPKALVPTTGGDLGHRLRWDRQARRPVRPLDHHRRRERRFPPATAHEDFM